MQSQYVDQFFKDGSLRLSSFRLFAKHADEGRRDTTEGRNILFGTNDKASVFMMVAMGFDCFVLCGTTSNIESTKKDFSDCDACLVIDDTIEFANRVSFQIPYFKRGIEGPVIYSDDPSIGRSLGPASADEMLEKYKLPNGEINMDMLSDLRRRMGGPEEMFVKSGVYAHQSEYRLLWQSSQPTSDFIDIKAPDAIQFCRKMKK